ncbi:MAG: polysaccharide biosynthesis protein [Candidatus Dadabacteria bacterium]|nr:MAG: polysaccharide biosynthesis protein [Candidatus Dadabacteria bacterium]
MWTLATPLAFWLRLDREIGEHLGGMLLLTAIGAVTKPVWLWWFGVHRRTWRATSYRDVGALARVIIAYSLLLFAGAVFLQQRGWTLPRSAPLIEGMTALLLLLGGRLLLRWIYERRQLSSGTTETRRVLIAGAGDAGTMIARELLRHPDAGLTPVGFVDDDRARRKDSVAGLPILGTLTDIGPVAGRIEADELLIAMPSAPGSVIRRVVEQAQAAGIRYRIIPGLYDLVSGRVEISQIRTVDVEDLLRREPVRLDLDNISGYLRGKRVLVTGAGGSIGSELVRQIARFEPEELLLLGRGENSIYQIAGELAANYPELTQIRLIANVCDRERISGLFEQHRPHAVFHAAAHKHVPLMEENPCEAIRNNVGGTKNVVDAALATGVAHFVNVSTDKAVSPSNLMGLSKRIAEMVVHDAALRADNDQVFCSVRFGNVLGSRGSVLPLFREQLRRGGPLTVTDERMTRFFMTIPEAAQLVIQAGAFGENDRLYVLDMGEPVRIYDLACDLIRLSGLEPDVDISIRVTGIRPGEKLHEELADDDEQIGASPHPKIHAVQTSHDVPAHFHERIDALLRAAAQCDLDQMLACCDQLVPGFLARYRKQQEKVAGS